MTDPIEVFVPAHVTAFFSVHRATDPAQTGSRGVGLALSDGIRVTSTPADTTRVTLDGDETTIDAVERVTDTFDVAAHIQLDSDVPLGAGFGVSGAMALGTAFGLNVISDHDRTENQLVRLAHVAEVEAGTGLGDVVAQHRGGIPIRVEPGAPEYGVLDGIPGGPRVEYLALGELSTEAVLSGDVERLNRAGSTALERLRAEPTLDRLMDESHRFATATELLPPDIQGIIDDVADAGGTAAMAMLGQTVFTLGRGLTDAGYSPAIATIDHGGVRYPDGDGSVFYSVGDDP